MMVRNEIEKVDEIAIVKSDKKLKTKIERDLERNGCVRGREQRKEEKKKRVKTKKKKRTRKVRIK